MNTGYDARQPLTEKADIPLIQSRFFRQKSWYVHCSEEHEGRRLLSIETACGASSG
jgi:hypothetical protein